MRSSVSRANVDPVRVTVRIPGVKEVKDQARPIALAAPGVRLMPPKFI
jgi:hypothetical protein